MLIESRKRFLEAQKSSRQACLQLGV
jgi:hypothetical protein